MRKAPLLIVAILVLALGAALLLYRGRTAGPGRPEATPLPAASESAGRPAPAFALKDVDGNTVDSSRFAGKATVINFFASWCPPCRQETPGFVEVHEKYRDKGLEMVGISLDTDTSGNLPRFIADNRIGYRVLLGNPEIAREFGGVQAVPTTFFVGKDGLIRNVHVGYMAPEKFESEVRKIL